MAEASPTLHSDNQGTQSGDDGTDVGQVTTKEPNPDVTQPNHTVEYTDILDTTTMEEEGTVTLHTESGWCLRTPVTNFLHSVLEMLKSFNLQ